MYYIYGRATQLDEDEFGFELTSLQDMTELSADGQWSPYYNDYIDYFKSDKYINQLIMDSFDEPTNVANENLEQRRAYIVTLIKSNVVPEFMMGLLGLALQICRDSDNDASPTLYWDAFAAMYIGSMEGIKPSVSADDGQLLWGLAMNRARQFNTQNDNFGSIINDEFTDLLFSGQAQLERGDCTNFDKTASRVLHLMLIPLIQSTIWYAINNVGVTSTKDKALAIGEAYALSVLPIVSKYDEDAASDIERNMIRATDQGVGPVTEGPQKVANAFYQILDNIGWGCEYIGQAEGVDTCDGYVAANLRSTGSMQSASGAAFFA